MKADADLRDERRFLAELHERFRGLDRGKPADYIPELAKVAPDTFGIAMATVDGRATAVGDTEARFTIQSLSKPFVYGLALDTVGRKAVRRKVGVEPTGEAFNSILELEEEVHRPYNPMINAGAIAIAGLLQEVGGDAAARQATAMFEDYMGHPVAIDQAVLASEMATAHRNRAIAHLLRHFDVIGDDIDGILELYFRQCSVLATVADLAMMAATLANGGVHPVTGKQAVKPQFVRDILALMFTCGLYDSAGEWAYSVGLPAKSGVSGGLIAVVPGRMGLAVYSPPLDSHGHSVRGMEVFKAWSQEWDLSMFG
jgi:glutaminase